MWFLFPKGRISSYSFDSHRYIWFPEYWVTSLWPYYNIILKIIKCKVNHVSLVTLGIFHKPYIGCAQQKEVEWVIKFICLCVPISIMVSSPSIAIAFHFQLFPYYHASLILVTIIKYLGMFNLWLCNNLKLRGSNLDCFIGLLHVVHSWSN